MRHYTNSELRRKYSRLRAEGKLSGTIKSAVEKRRQRINSRRVEPVPAQLEVITLGPKHAALAASVVRDRYPRRQNWNHAEARSYRLRGADVEHLDHGRYSYTCRYNRVSYTPVMRACGRVTAGRALILIGGDVIRLTAPRGWRYGRDNYGLYLVRLRETREAFRYHPTSDEWSAGLAALRSTAIAHEQTQQRVARDRRAELSRARAEARQAERQASEDAALLATVPVYVCLRDSRRAGNCAAGTAAWARQRGLDARQHVPADLVRILAKRNRQALRVIEYAERRTLEELRRGYSLMSDHCSEVF